MLDSLIVHAAGWRRSLHVQCAATAQHRRNAGSEGRHPTEARGRFFNTGNAFNVKLPPVPDHSFVAEPRLALDPAT